MIKVGWGCAHFRNLNISSICRALVDFKDKHSLEKARLMGMRLGPQILKHHFWSVEKYFGSKGDLMWYRVWEILVYFLSRWRRFTPTYYRNIQCYIICALCKHLREKKKIHFAFHFVGISCSPHVHSAARAPMPGNHQVTSRLAGPDGDFECCTNSSTRIRRRFGERPRKSMGFSNFVYTEYIFQI